MKPTVWALRRISEFIQRSNHCFGIKPFIKLAAPSQTNLNKTAVPLCGMFVYLIGWIAAHLETPHTLFKPTTKLHPLCRASLRAEIQKRRMCVCVVGFPMAFFFLSPASLLSHLAARWKTWWGGKEGLNRRVKFLRGNFATHYTCGNSRMNYFIAIILLPTSSILISHVLDVWFYKKNGSEWESRREE